MISLAALVHFIVYLVVAGLIFWLLDWMIGRIGLQEPFNKVARTILVVLAVLIVIFALLQLIGAAPPLFRA